MYVDPSLGGETCSDTRLQKIKSQSVIWILKKKISQSVSWILKQDGRPLRLGTNWVSFCVLLYNTTWCRLPAAWLCPPRAVEGGRVSVEGGSREGRGREVKANDINDKRVMRETGE